MKTFEPKTPVRVIVTLAGAPADAETGILTEVPARQARPATIIRDLNASVRRPAWPYEYDLPLGTEVSL